MASSPGQQPPVAAPRAARRTRVIGVAECQEKNKLVEAFEGFNASTVAAYHVSSAMKCIESGASRKQRYVYVPFDDILAKNEKSDKPDYLNMMTSAYDLLLKYVINLLKPKRPQVWRSIKTNNVAFKARVSCMLGSIEILKKVGYSEEGENSLQFPDYVQDPDKKKLYVIAAELLMAKLEVEQLSQQPPVSPNYNYENIADSNNQRVVRASTDYIGRPNALVQSGNDYSGSSGDWMQSHNPANVSFAQGHHENSSGVGAQQPSPVDPPPPRPKPRTAFVYSTLSKESESMFTPPQTPSQERWSSEDHTRHGNRSGEQQTSDSERPSSANSTASSSSEISSQEPGSESKPNDFSEMLKRFKKKREAAKAKHTRNISTQSREQAQLSDSEQTPTNAVASPETPKTPQKDSSFSTSTSPQIKRPPNQPKPEFHSDTILEEDETRLLDRPQQQQQHYSPSTPHKSILQEAPANYCPNCHNKLRSGERSCAYCQQFVNGGEEVRSKYGQWPQQQEENHQVIQSPPPVPAPRVPPRPPKPRQSPVQTQAPANVPLRASMEDAEQAAQEQMRFSEFQRQASSNTTPFNHPVAHTQYPQHNAQYPETSQGGASGTSVASGVTKRPSDNSMSGIELLRLKEEAYKAKQRKDGVREENLERLPELVQAEKEYERAREQHKNQEKERARQQAMKNKNRERDTPVADRYARVDLSSLHYIKQEKEERKMDILKRQGQEFLHCIQECSKEEENYSLQEVEIAFNEVLKLSDKSGQKRTKTVLQYLKEDWSAQTQRARNWVSVIISDQPSVGLPSVKDTREALVAVKGDINKAVDALYKDRSEKIEALLGRFQMMRAMQPDLPELTWEAAVKALSANSMDVDTACYAIQCEWLQPLYESIFSDYKGVKQTEMEEIKKLVTNKENDEEVPWARHRMLMAECNLTNVDRADVALKLIEEVEEDGMSDYPLHYYVDAARDFPDLESARSFLKKECPICDALYPIHEMVTMPGCTDNLCKECFKAHFRIVLTEKGVKHFNCPICSLPDMSDRDLGDFYFGMFQALIKEHLNKELYDLSSEKLKDFNLSKEDNFVWCANDQCRSGWIYDGVRGVPHDIQCPHCKKSMCVMCKKPWETQHEDTTCQAFAKWKAENDPNAQEKGLAAHLNANGIECPQCKMKYDLARGGCMHFKCTRCPNEFCSGCGESFKNGQLCGKLASCNGRGLHAHHPRDCLFYLRDLDVAELQQFLRDNKEEFDTEPPKEQVEAARRKKREAQKQKEPQDEEAAEEAPEEVGEPDKEDEEKEDLAAPPAAAPAAAEDEGEVELHCRVEEQKETVDGLQDEPCGRNVEKGHAGLCFIHYKEYLVNKINKAKLDPVTIYTNEKVGLMLTREELDIPEREDVEEDDQYRERLIQEVKAKLPLTHTKPGENPPQNAEAAQVNQE